MFAGEVFDNHHRVRGQSEPSLRVTPPGDRRVPDLHVVMPTRARNHDQRATSAGLMQHLRVLDLEAQAQQFAGAIQERSDPC